MNNICTSFFRIALALATAFGAGCGKDKDSDSSNDGDELIGTWTTPCLAAGDVFEMRQLIFKDTGFAFTDSFHSDDACTTTNSVISGVGSFKLGGSFGDGTAVDYTFIRYTWAFSKDPGLADEYAAACESTATNGIVDVLDKTCSLSGTDEVAFYSPAFGVLSIFGGKLFASTYVTNGDSEETRSSELNGGGGGWEKLPEVEQTALR